MANLILTTNSTTLVNLATNDRLYITPDASIIRNGICIQSTTNTQFNTNVSIDGTVTGYGTSATILLNGTNAAGSIAGAGSHEVSIGTTGIVRSVSLGFAVFTAGTQNFVFNHGQVHSQTSAIVNNGADYTLLNTGLVSGLTKGVDVIQGGALVTNTGQITAVAFAGVDMFGDLSLLQNAGQISGATGVVFDGNRNTLANRGDISGVAGVALDGDDNTLSNAAGGSIAGSAAGLRLDGGGTTNVTNSGTITGGQIGISVASLTTLLTNHGVIEGTGNFAIQATFAAAALTILNTGTIRAGIGQTEPGAALEGNFGVEVVSNTGSIVGNLLLGDGADRVTNGGIIRGTVDMGAGADRVTNTDGRIFGSILGGTGNDTLTGGALAENLQGGAGLDRILGGGGNDRITAGIGTDIVTGGAGADVFVYTSAATLGIGAARDAVTDFVHLVDDFEMIFMATFIGNAAFTAAGQVRYVQATGLLTGSTDGDAAAEWVLLLVNKPLITGADFVF